MQSMQSNCGNCRMVSHEHGRVPTLGKKGSELRGILSLGFKGLCRFMDIQ